MQTDSTIRIYCEKDHKHSQPLSFGAAKVGYSFTTRYDPTPTSRVPRDLDPHRSRRCFHCPLCFVRLESSVKVGQCERPVRKSSIFDQNGPLRCGGRNEWRKNVRYHGLRGAIGRDREAREIHAREPRVR